MFRLINSHLQAYSLQVKSQDVVHTLGSQYVYISEIFKPYHLLRRVKLAKYEAYLDSKYRLAVKKPSKVSYKILLLSDSTFFKLFFHIFAAIIEALLVAGHKFLYTVLIECGRPPAMLATTDSVIEWSP